VAQCSPFLKMIKKGELYLGDMLERSFGIKVLGFYGDWLVRGDNSAWGHMRQPYLSDREKSCRKSK